MPSKKHGQLYAKLGMPYAKLGMLCSNLGMPQVFAGTPYEREERIHEESRGHRERHWVRSLVLITPRPRVSTTLRRSRRRAVGRGRAVPFRWQPCKREEHPSQREAPLREHLGMPSIGFETPNEERAMPTL
jgi:hypothetical protein